MRRRRILIVVALLLVAGGAAKPLFWASRSDPETRCTLAAFRELDQSRFHHRQSVWSHPKIRRGKKSKSRFTSPESLPDGPEGLCFCREK